MATYLLLLTIVIGGVPRILICPTVTLDRCREMRQSLLKMPDVTLAECVKIAGEEADNE